MRHGPFAAGACALIALFLGACAAAPAPEGAPDARAGFVGSWRLVEWTSRSAAGETVHPMGRDALGFILYTPEGRMSAHLAPRPSAPDGAEPPRAVAYSGPWSTGAGEVRHHVEIATIPAWIGSTLVRSYAFQGGNRLILSTPPSASGAVSTLVWERIAPGS